MTNPDKSLTDEGKMAKPEFDFMQIIGCGGEPDYVNAEGFRWWQQSYRDEEMKKAGLRWWLVVSPDERMEWALTKEDKVINYDANMKSATQYIDALLLSKGIGKDD